MRELLGDLEERMEYLKNMESPSLENTYRIIELDQVIVMVMENILRNDL